MGDMRLSTLPYCHHPMVSGENACPNLVLGQKWLTHTYNIWGQDYTDKRLSNRMCTATKDIFFHDVIYILTEAIMIQYLHTIIDREYTKMLLNLNKLVLNSLNIYYCINTHVTRY